MMTIPSGDAPPIVTIPLRRQWTSLWVGAVALGVSALLAAGVAGLLAVLLVPGDGTLVLLGAAILWAGGFFGSVPWQRRLARRLQQRGPCLTLTPAVLQVPTSPTPLLLQREALAPVEAGWIDTVVRSGGHATRWRETRIVVTQDGRSVILWADDSVQAAQQRGWPRLQPPLAEGVRVRLWAADVVLLGELLATPVPAGAPHTAYSYDHEEDS